ncbi:GNAT family N-acetyltransferase [Pseudoruegeria sp. HB172150]|uniref:GNAT family N-acetyltransferase n=1 Tax=Pseudoruegeria sp. HB172150 TaxID=2721164 RepID=UPI001551B585|nr:GNAT family N-acetyltransferase [Pseudoruegeria sp. HB172150]
MTVRPMTSGDHPDVAAVWHEGWHDAHDGLVPDRMSATRVPDAFLKAIAEMTKEVRVGLLDGRIGGFVAWQENYIDYLFLSRPVRGSGLAARLMQAAETEIAAAGHVLAEIDYVKGNDRAARFYAREGWEITGELDETREVEGAGMCSWCCVLLQKSLLQTRWAPLLPC